jgi:hypothetical protein
MRSAVRVRRRLPPLRVRRRLPPLWGRGTVPPILTLRGLPGLRHGRRVIDGRLRGASGRGRHAVTRLHPWHRLGERAAVHRIGRRLLEAAEPPVPGGRLAGLLGGLRPRLLAPVGGRPRLGSSRPPLTRGLRSRRRPVGSPLRPPSARRRLGCSRRPLGRGRKPLGRGRRWLGCGRRRWLGGRLLLARPLGLGGRGRRRLGRGRRPLGRYLPLAGWLGPRGRGRRSGRRLDTLARRARRPLPDRPGRALRTVGIGRRRGRRPVAQQAR